LPCSIGLFYHFSGKSQVIFLGCILALLKKISHGGAKSTEKKKFRKIEIFLKETDTATERRSFFESFSAAPFLCVILVTYRQYTEKTKERRNHLNNTMIRKEN